MALRIASWNVNSIRVRVDHVGQLVDRYQPDILCLQETKAADAVFPTEPLREWGYVHQALSGAVGAPGVAILSRRPFAEVIARDWCRRQDHRHVEVKLENGLWIDNFYVPAGGDLPDAQKNPKFAHKLQFLAEMAAHYRAQTKSGSDGNTGAGGLRRRLLVGDLNVAPLQTDVWLHKKLKNTVTHTQVEIAALDEVSHAFDAVDLMRRFVPADTPLFTWWSYRSRDWTQNNRGRRLDHAWATPALAPHCTGMTVARETRSWRRPSDHIPVLVDLNMS